MEGKFSTGFHYTSIIRGQGIFHFSTTKLKWTEFLIVKCLTYKNIQKIIWWTPKYHGTIILNFLLITIQHTIDFYHKLSIKNTRFVLHILRLFTNAIILYLFYNLILVRFIDVDICGSRSFILTFIYYLIVWYTIVTYSSVHGHSCCLQKFYSSKQFCYKHSGDPCISQSTCVSLG